MYHTFFEKLFAGMKQLLPLKNWLLLAVGICFFSLAAVAQETDEVGCKDLESLRIAESRRARALASFRSVTYISNYDLKYHRLEWEIDPARYYIKGTVTSYFVPLDQNFQKIQFNLSKQLAVSKVAYRGQSINFVQTSSDLLEITFPATLAKGKIDSVSVTYEGKPFDSGFGSFVQTTHQGTPVIWTLSEPYGAQDWWPCKQTLTDKIDSLDVYLRTSSAYRGTSNGVLVDEKTDGANKIYHWRHRYPIATYLVALAVTNYSVYSEYAHVSAADSILVLNYIYPESVSSAKAGTPSAVKSLELFSRLFGLYPFAKEKYGHAQFGWGGGMEHQTMSYVVSFSHSLLSHELAHQWFGDKVTCGSWSDIWLNEGFATFCEGLTYQYGLGSNTWKNWVTSKLGSVVSAPGGSVYCRDTSSVDAIFDSRLSYSKGGLVLNMLKWKLGDAAFFKGIQNYLKDPTVAYGFALTAALQRNLENASGQKLDVFFKNWVYGEGYPSYKVEWSVASGNKPGLVKLSQTTSSATVNFFPMPVPIKFSGQGKDTLVVFDHVFSGQQFILPKLSFVPTLVTFDPDLQLISAKNTVTQNNTLTATEDILLLQVKVYPNPTADILQIELPESVQATGPARIFNIQGQELKQLADRQAMSLAGLPSGIYLFQLPTNHGLLRRLVMKE